MKRKLKFRAWSDEGKKMVDLQELTPSALVINPQIVGAGIGVYIPDKKGIHIMQYTGLKDKNGNNIYESDVIIDPDNDIWFVQWLDVQAGFVLKDAHSQKWCTLDEWGESTALEIKGNIYENPELLNNLHLQ